jgi:hypothetical protein
MINFTVILKKGWLIAMMLLLGALSTKLYAQEIKLKVSKDSTLINGNYTYSISIKILNGKAPYNIEIYDNLLKNGGKLISKEENINQSVVNFSNFFANQTLYINVECISNKQGVTTFVKF